MSDLARLPLSTLPGVGPVRAERLCKLGLASVRDLLLLVPRKLLPPAVLGSIAESLQPGRRVRVRGVVKGLSFYRRGRRRSVLRVRIEDDTGAVDLLFFNQPWMKKRFQRGTEIGCEGLVVDAGGLAISTPRLIDEEEPAGVPLALYPLTKGIGQEFLRALTRTACERHLDDLDEPLTGESRERLHELGLPDLDDAVRGVHLSTEEDGFDAGRRRLALERLLALQARLARASRQSRAQAARMEVSDAEFEDLLAGFPAALTAAQRRAATDLRRDLGRRTPMRRLLQGDVGSGKTWVGAIACLLAARSGHQAAFMAPTELLAEQHYFGLLPLFERLGIEPVLLTGSVDRARRRQVVDALETGRAAVAFGTHALLSSDVRFPRLALAIVDEQHRFGVGQRQRLFEKGRDVHVLLMTATPIPRTLALTVYGDLEVALLDELPPGRGGTRTRRVRPEKVADMRSFLLERVRAGERVFWVSPRIDGEDGAASAYEAWSRELDGVELVHGRLHAEERVARLERFRRGTSPLLVATTVVEVGVDVPEATVMVVDGAHRLGLAQLHQLRGRVGRGSRPAWCFLVGDDVAEERLSALERTSDGFELAELDLAQRGMGTLTGLRQAGINDEGLAELVLDLPLVELARRAVREDPALVERYS